MLHLYKLTWLEREIRYYDHVVTYIEIVFIKM